jgi:hypothetical protein
VIALLVGIVVALAAVALVLEPIVRPPRAAPPDALSFEPEDDPLGRRKDLALAALKEIEFDRATGKLDAADYERMKARYTAEALEAIRDADAAAAPVPREPALARAQVPAGVGADGAAAALADPLEALVAARRKASKGRKFCTECGAELEGTGKFCVECGAGLAGGVMGDGRCVIGDGGEREGPARPRCIQRPFGPSRRTRVHS